MALKMILSLKDNLSGDMKGPTKALKSFGKVALGVGKVAVTGIAAASGAILTLAATSADVEIVGNTFSNLASTIGETSDSMMRALRPATKGVLSDFALMSGGSKLMSMGLANSAAEAATLAEMATTLGMAMGEEAGPAMENFTLMLANQSIPRLDTFGISSGKVRTRIEELITSTAGMTREQAFMQAVMEEGAVAMERVGDVGDVAGIKMAQLKATFANLKDTVGVALLPILNALLTPLLRLAQTIGPLLIPWVEKAVDAFEDFQIGLSELWTSTLQPILNAVIEWVQKVLDIDWSNLGNVNWREIFPDWLADTILWISNAFETLKRAFDFGGFSVLVAQLGMIFGQLWGKLKEKAAEWAGGAMEALHAVINMGIGYLKDKVPEWIAKIGPAVAELWSKLKEKAAEWASSATDFWNETIKPGIAGLTDKVGEWAEALGPKIVSFWSLMQGKVSVWTAQAVRFWNNTIKPGIEGLGAKVSDWVAALKIHIDAFWLKLVGKSVGWLESQESSFAQQIADAWEELLVNALSLVRTEDITVEAMMDKVYDAALADMKANGPSRAAELGTEYGDSIVKAIESIDLTKIWQAIVGIFDVKNMQTTRKDEMKAAGDELIGIMWKSMIDAIKGGGAQESADAVGAAMMGGVANGITTNAFLVSDAGIAAVKDSIPLIMKGIDAHSPSKLTEEIGEAMAGGMEVGLANKVTSIVNAAVGAAWAVINAVTSVLDIGSPSKVFMNIGQETMAGLQSGIQQGVTGVAQVMADIGDLVLRFSDLFWAIGGDPNLERAQSIATTMTSIAGMFIDVIDAFDELANYQGVEGLGDAIMEIMAEMHDSVNRAIGLAWTWWDAELERAAVVASLIGDLVGLIVPALEAFDALDGWEPPDNLGAKINRFAAQLSGALTELGRVTRVDTDWIGLAEWAAEVEPAIGLIQGAVDALAAIAEYKVVAGLGAKIKALAGQIGIVVVEFKKVSEWRAEWPDLSAFASAVQNATSPIKNAIDALAALAEYKAVAGLGAKIESLAGQMGIVTLAIKRVDAWREEWPDLTGFAGAVNTAVSLIKGPIDALTALADYEPVQNIGEKITALANQIGIVVLAFKKIAGWRAEWDSVGEFSENAKKAMELMKSALDALGALAEFGTEYITPQKFYVFGDIVRFAVEMIAWVAYSLGPKAAEAAGAFAEYGKTIFDMMKSALSFLGDLNETALPEEAKVAAFIQTLRGILGQFTVGANVAANIAQQAYGIGNSLAYASAASGFGESFGITRVSVPKLPTPTRDWGGVIGAPPVYSGGGGGGGTAGGEWQQAMVDLRDMYKEDRAAGNSDSLLLRSAMIRVLADIFPDVQREAGAAY